MRRGKYKCFVIRIKHQFHYELSGVGYTASRVGSLFSVFWYLIHNALSFESHVQLKRWHSFAALLPRGNSGQKGVSSLRPPFLKQHNRRDTIKKMKADSSLQRKRQNWKKKGQRKVEDHSLCTLKSDSRSKWTT